MGRGGFVNSANFVSKYLTSKSFDAFGGDFTKRSKTATRVKVGFPAIPKTNFTAGFIHKELFDKRNRIMHWGAMNYGKQDAEQAFIAALTAMAVLRAIDKEKADELDRKLRP